MSRICIRCRRRYFASSSDLGGLCMNCWAENPKLEASESASGQAKMGSVRTEAEPYGAKASVKDQYHFDFGEKDTRKAVVAAVVSGLLFFLLLRYEIFINLCGYDLILKQLIGGILMAGVTFIFGLIYWRSQNTVGPLVFYPTWVVSAFLIMPHGCLDGLEALTFFAASFILSMLAIFLIGASIEWIKAGDEKKIAHDGTAIDGRASTLKRQLLKSEEALLDAEICSGFSSNPECKQFENFDEWRKVYLDECNRLDPTKAAFEKFLKQDPLMLAYLEGKDPIEVAAYFVEHFDPLDPRNWGGER